MSKYFFLSKSLLIVFRFDFIYIYILNPSYVRFSTYFYRAYTCTVLLSKLLPTKLWKNKRNFKVVLKPPQNIHPDFQGECRLIVFLFGGVSVHLKTY